MVNINTVTRVTIPQLEFLAQCMEKFPSLALASFGKSREETNCAHKKWLQIGSALNKIKPGVTKTGLGWLRYWTNYKYQLRKRYPQLKWSWVSNAPARVTPLEHRFLEVLADHERSQPQHVTFQGDKNAENYPTTEEEEKVVITNYSQQETSQPMPTKQETSHSMPTKQESLQYMPTKQENLEFLPRIQEILQPMPTMQVIDVSRQRNLESPVQDDDKNSMEDPIGTEKETKEEIQVEILKFNLKRQREMHELEMEHMKERHRLEIEILQLKKKKLMQDCDRLRSNFQKIINN